MLSNIAPMCRNQRELYSDVVYMGHENYVSSVAVREPCSEYPDGLIITGSNDKLIRGYLPGDPQEIISLPGHSDNVSALDADSRGLILSGSWDKTARLWKDCRCIATLKGHEAAVWGVRIIPCNKEQLDIVDIVTCSADKTLKTWRIQLSNVANDEVISCQSTMMGHTDCVRSLAVYDRSHVLSASNDSSIRAWDLSTNSCVAEFYGHTNFVYSVAVQVSSNIMVSSGEDRTVRVWDLRPNEWAPGRHFQCVQAITLPCLSVWCVDLMPNGDIVAGGSDHSIRLFSRDPIRQASEEVSGAFQAEVSACRMPKQTAVADSLDENNLPGPEALANPGRREGQTLLIKDGPGTIICYQWSSLETRWVKVGDVVGTDTKKSMFEGREYDFVFDVDFDDAIGNVKLPFNRDEDPWMVAQQFIHKHNLPQDYLDTIAKYIVKNAGLDKVKQPVSGSRDVTGGFCDPFTGSSPVVSQVYFPATVFVSMEMTNFSALTEKLRSLNGGMSEPLDAALINGPIAGMSEKADPFEAAKLAEVVLRVFPSWSVSSGQVPLLDLLRYMARWWPVCEVLFTSQNWQIILEHSLVHADRPAPNCLLAVRLLCNAVEPCFAEARKAKMVQPQLKAILDIVHPLMGMVEKDQLNLSNSKMMQVAMATFFHNLSVMATDREACRTLAHHHPTIHALHGLCLRFAFGQLKRVQQEAKAEGSGALTRIHPEALFRLLVTVGTTLVGFTTDRMQRICLLTAAAEGVGDTARNPEIGSDEFAADWEACRAILDFWAKSATSPAKVRECAQAILEAVE